eukprot:GHVN01075547.1.p1 GENE.GHVN01075547.1~~GHVN01075547.1.p1  ORF type:complete len:115 (+),score=7.35 GHVN01075547.1:255-599(+)
MNVFNAPWRLQPATREAGPTKDPASLSLIWTSLLNSLPPTAALLNLSVNQLHVQSTFTSPSAILLLLHVYPPPRIYATVLLDMTYSIKLYECRFLKHFVFERVDVPLGKPSAFW